MSGNDIVYVIVVYKHFKTLFTDNHLYYNIMDKRLAVEQRLLMGKSKTRGGLNLGNKVTGKKSSNKKHSNKITNIIYSVQKMIFINLCFVYCKGLFRSYVVKVDWLC